MAITRITTGENSPPQASGIGDVVNSGRRPRGSAQERSVQFYTSCENLIFIRNAGTNPKVMAVRSKVNVNPKNLIMSLADSCFEFLRDLEMEHDPDLVRRRAAEFTEDVRHHSRLIELT